MLKKTITYKDLDGKELTEDFYFNLSTSELAEMEAQHNGGYSAYLKAIVETGNGGVIMGVFKQILTDSIGRRSENGKFFEKDSQIAKEFLQSDAYTVLFWELVTQSDKAAEFLRGLMPADLQQKTAELQQRAGVETTLQDDRPAWEKENRDPTPAELKGMTPDQLRKAFAAKAGGQ